MRLPKVLDHDTMPIVRFSSHRHHAENQTTVNCRRLFSEKESDCDVRIISIDWSKFRATIYSKFNVKSQLIMLFFHKVGPNLSINILAYEIVRVLQRLVKHSMVTGRKIESNLSNEKKNEPNCIEIVGIFFQ